MKNDGWPLQDWLEYQLMLLMSQLLGHFSGINL